MQRDTFGQLITSSEDGTVRLWRFNQPNSRGAGGPLGYEYSCSVIDLRPKEREGGNKKDASGRKRSNKPTKINIAAFLWSLDDSRIITAATLNPGKCENAPAFPRLQRSRIGIVFADDRELEALSALSERTVSTLLESRARLPAAQGGGARVRRRWPVACGVGCERPAPQRRERAKAVRPREARRDGAGCC